MGEAIKYGRATCKRVIFLALQLTYCRVCTVPIIRGQLFTKGWPGDGQARVCYDCRPFEVLSVNVNWEDNERPEPDFVEI